jgi:hypothetical protein
MLGNIATPATHVNTQRVHDMQNMDCYTHSNCCVHHGNTSLNFIANLPESIGNKNIKVVIDQFTKMAYFIPMEKRE